MMMMWNKFKCWLLKHKWRYWEGGHVHPEGWFNGAKECVRCGLTVEF